MLPPHTDVVAQLKQHGGSSMMGRRTDTSTKIHPRWFCWISVEIYYLKIYFMQMDQTDSLWILGLTGWGQWRRRRRRSSVRSRNGCVSNWNISSQTLGELTASKLTYKLNVTSQTIWLGLCWGNQKHEHVSQKDFEIWTQSMFKKNYLKSKRVYFCGKNLNCLLISRFCFPFGRPEGALKSTLSLLERVKLN